MPLKAKVYMAICMASAIALGYEFYLHTIQLSRTYRFIIYLICLFGYLILSLQETEKKK